MSRSPFVVRVLVTAVLAVAPAPRALSQAAPKKPLTVESASDPDLAQRGMSEIVWRDAERFTALLPEGTGAEAAPALWQVDAATRKKTRLTDAPAVPGEEKKKLSLKGYAWNPEGTAVLLSGADDLWLWDATTSAVKRLTSAPGEEEDATFSPDGARVAFVRSNDLYVLDLASGQETRLTTAGAEHILNGKLDWVYEEELAGRRHGRSYEWSPDSRAIAYLRLDETRVPGFPIVDFTPPNGKLLPQRYPKAGDPNSLASVHIVALNGRETASFSLDGDGYIAPEFAWTADGKDLCFATLDRAQTALTVQLLARAGGAPRVLLTEKDAAWINAIHPPHFLKDGGFVFLSERTGYFHLYRYAKDGTLRNAITKGDWMLDLSWEIDEKRGVAWFFGTEKDPRERHVYRVNLDGTGLTRVTQGRGNHTFKLSPDGALLAHTFSDLDTPPKTNVLKADGTLVLAADDAAPAFADLALATTELGSFRTADGTLLYTRLVKPRDFDPQKKYPAVVYVYGGPHAQLIQDRWGSTSLFDSLMAERGILVWTVDNRGSWGRGHAFEAPLLRAMGGIELRDQLEGLDVLAKLPFVDASRIGVWGWSYGGFMTLTLATHAGARFVCAAAGAPVVDWRLYDTIYTERYMKLPKDNVDGYKASAPLLEAKSLSTKLLLFHGTFDDNVHIQNSILFIDELMKARKDFVFVPLPRQKHGPRKEALLYRNERLLRFFEENLKP